MTNTFLTDQEATGTGSVALKSKITPSLPWNVVPFNPLHLSDSGRRARAAKDEVSCALATATQHLHVRVNNQKKKKSYLNRYDAVKSRTTIVFQLPSSNSDKDEK